MPPKRLVLARPRGFCAGVTRAVDVVESALELCGRPLYVRHEIVHNRHVVEALRRKGAVFVEELSEVPEGSWVVFSAHGVSPAVRVEAARRRLRVIDATCPLVAKVHLEVRRFAREGRTVLLVGRKSHAEMAGTRGEAPGSVLAVATKEEAERVEVPDPSKAAYLTQTTLSLDDTREIVDVLRRRFPGIAGPAKDDICYASQNRQRAVQALAEQADVVLVVGAPHSSNSRRLVEVARARGAKAHLVESVRDLRREWLDGAEVLGLTSSASAPEHLVEGFVRCCREELGIAEVVELDGVREGVRFAPPAELRKLRRTAL